jgi:OmpA-OmpF porin, OOP family
MNILRQPRYLIASVPIITVLFVSGCATRHYVRRQVQPVQDHLAQLQTQTNDLSAKHSSDISRVDERIATTDSNLGVVATTANNAAATANLALNGVSSASSAAQQAMAAANAAGAKIDADSSQIANLMAANNYTLAETANVTFGFDQSDLTPDAKVALDLVIAKAASQPRSVFEVTGYTDDIGQNSYNLALSRKRAEAVARYLVAGNVPLKNISVIGMGEEQTPTQIAAEVKAVDPNASKADIRSLARRVRVRMYEPGGSTPSAQVGGGGAVAASQ